MNSEQRRAARRKRREEKRARAKAERVKACTLETVADLNSLCKASKQAARGVMWKASTQRYMKDYLRNAVKSRQDLLEGRDICRGFIRFDLWERGKLRHISAVHFPERVVQKSLSQNALVPAIVPTLVSANSANIKGRGTDYALKLLKRHLADHWQRHGSLGRAPQRAGHGRAVPQPVRKSRAGGVAQCNQARETIRAERPRHSGRAATQNGGLDGSKTK